MLRKRSCRICPPFPSPGCASLSLGGEIAGPEELAGAGRGEQRATYIGSSWLKRAKSKIWGIFANLLLNRPVIKIKVTIKKILEIMVINTQNASLPNYFYTLHYVLGVISADCVCAVGLGVLPVAVYLFPALFGDITLMA